MHALRSARHWSLADLAERSGVSRSMLSLVERGESSPTAVVLERIAAGLGVSLATLFETDAAPASPVVRAAERTPWRDPQSGYLRRNISPPNYPSPLQIVDVVLPAGAHVAYESGPRPPGLAQQIWVQEGTVEVTIGTVTHRLAADDCLAMELTAPTAFHNPTRRAARYVVVLSREQGFSARA